SWVRAQRAPSSPVMVRPMRYPISTLPGPASSRPRALPIRPLPFSRCPCAAPSILSPTGAALRGDGLNRRRQRNRATAGPEFVKGIGAPREHTPVKQAKKNNFTRQDILRVLRRNDELLQKHAVRRIALFGSYATGRQNRKSDLDFLVDFERPTYD